MVEDDAFRIGVPAREERIARERRADGTIKADPQAGLKSILTVSDYCSSGPWSCGPG
ncbi:MAG: hypothetical protein IJQ35_10460 [Bacteroidales bacterium]|nr:hypothetical protein [Bacteroidales bacterium]